MNPSLESLEVGALPIVNSIIDRLGLEEILDRHLTASAVGRPRQLPPGRVARVMLVNILLSRLPLYAVPAWLQRFSPDLLGLQPGQEELFNDDRIGRTLEQLFDAHHGTLATEAVVRALRLYQVQTKQLHNDSTTVTFRGKYNRSRRRNGKEAPKITFGFNKDHRPDLKQLVYELSISADGAIPIHFGLHDGNVTDDQTHRDTWMSLRELSGSPNFVYVADSKLCVSQTLRFIHEQKGTFVTVLPKTRSEDAWFRKYIRENGVSWQEVRRTKNRRSKSEPDDVYDAIESPQRSAEGFRILWYRSSLKAREDQDRRFGKIGVARVKLDLLQSRQAKRRFRDLEEAETAAAKILDDLGVAPYLTVTAEWRTFEEFRQQGSGRPGPNTRYRRDNVTLVFLNVDENTAAIRDAAKYDGIFPLITNSETFTLERTLAIYKYQPFLEKRHEQLKSVFDIAPVFLKNPTRIASMLLLYFLALLVSSLLEREVRRQMKKAKIESLPIYPEERLCKAPTAEVVLDTFSGLRRHRLRDEAGNATHTFHDALPDVAHTLLTLLGVDPSLYGFDS